MRRRRPTASARRAIAYHQALACFKRSLEGSERDTLAKVIDSGLAGSGAAARVLDIGTGDGSYLAKLIRTLEIPSASVTALEPCPTAFLDAARTLAGGSIHRERIEDYQPDGDFDIVLAVQSLYYTNDAEASFHAMQQLVSDGGIAAAVVWSTDCVLRSLARQVFPGSADLCGESLIEAAAHPLFPGMTRLELYQGPVNFDAWRSSTNLLRCAAKVISRQSLTSSDLDYAAREIKRALRHHDSRGLRSNCILTYSPA